MVAQNRESTWGQLMLAPWGEQSQEAEAAKAEAVIAYRTSWEAWRTKRIADGKWVGAQTTYDEV